MVGLIWTIQVVHYPLFAYVGESSFVGYEQRHTTRMGSLLAVPASVEVVTGGLLLWFGPVGLDSGLVFAGGAVLAALWLTTWLVHVPLHRELSSAVSKEAMSMLVVANWGRTIGWTARGVIGVMMIGQAL